MKPTTFEGANMVFAMPSQGIRGEDVRGWAGQIIGGECDGSAAALIAWECSAEDIERLKNGGKLYFLSLGGIPVHSVSTEMPLVLPPIPQE